MPNKIAGEGSKDLSKFLPDEDTQNVHICNSGDRMNANETGNENVSANTFSSVFEHNESRSMVNVVILSHLVTFIHINQIKASISEKLEGN